MDRHAWSAADSILGPDRRLMLDDPDVVQLPGRLWPVADARLSAHRGDRRGAQERVRRALVGRTRLSWAIPWYAVRCLALLAQVELMLRGRARRSRIRPTSRPRA
jgi:hypothetical protein